MQFALESSMLLQEARSPDLVDAGGVGLAGEEVKQRELVVRRPRLEEDGGVFPLRLVVEVWASEESLVLDLLIS
jgi:hypothetical protein